MVKGQPAHDDVVWLQGNGLAVGANLVKDGTVGEGDPLLQACSTATVLEEGNLIDRCRLEKRLAISYIRIFHLIGTQYLTTRILQKQSKFRGKGRKGNNRTSTGMHNQSAQ